MLLTDGLVVSSADLLSLDAEVVDLAAREEQSHTSGPDSLLRRAQERAVTQLVSATRSFGSCLGEPGISRAHLAAVHNTGFGPAQSYARVAPEQVVASSAVADTWNPVKQWLAQFVLADVYLAAVNRPGDDRYVTRYNMALRERDDAYQNLQSLGLPVVAQPLHRPGSWHGAYGTWSEDNLSLVSGGNAADTSIEVAITWTNAARLSQVAGREDGESAPSERAVLSATPGNNVQIDISPLTPLLTAPERAGEYGEFVTPMIPDGWNIYAAVQGETLRLQNSEPLPISTTTYTIQDTLVVTSNPVGTGQRPDLNYYFNSVQIRRA